MPVSRIIIPDGYRIVEETETVDIFLADQWLSTRRQYRYTSATRNGDLAVLKKSSIICPHCGKRIPAYPRFTNACLDAFSLPDPMVPRDIVSAWASPQYTFCPRDWETLVFGTVCSPEGSVYTCPHCGLQSRAYRSNLEVTVSSRRGKISLSCKTQDLGDYLRISWGCRKSAPLPFPLEERLVFNLKTGKCWLSLCSGNGTMLAIRNIYDSEDWSSSQLFRLVKENLRVRRLLAKAFRSLWKGDFPFGARELTPQLLVLLCRHPGFPRNFYSRTPFEEGSHLAARSFRATAPRMRTPEALQKMLLHSSLPQVKSVRKRLFLSPEHCFYLPELEFLYSCIRNTDLFLQLLDRHFTFELLAFLHQYPYSSSADFGPGAFFRDYVALRSPQSLLAKLERRMGEVRIYAIHYGSLSPAARKREQRSWPGDTVHCCPPVPYSVPTRASAIPDTTIDKYDFFLLKNLTDCRRTGRELHNCLVDWEVQSNPVFAIMKNGHCVAAIEVRNDTAVVQAYGDRNTPLILRPAVYTAYLKWLDLFDLQEEEDEDDVPEAHPRRPRIMPLVQSAVL